jgi:predicted acetyltransferase
MELVPPSLVYEKSFGEAVEELRMENSMGFWEEIGSPKSIKEYVQIRIDHSHGKNLPQGWIPATTYWLVNGSEVIGEAHVRHELTSQLRIEGGHIGYWIRPSKRGLGYGRKILELVLRKAAQDIGITQFLVTCDETNTASRKIIESNGGVLERAQDLGVDKPKKLLFWIDV